MKQVYYCPHRGARLSDGMVKGSDLVCPYHGWGFGTTGALTHIPALSEDSALPACRLKSLPTHEDAHGLWVRIGDEPATPAPLDPFDGTVADWSFMTKTIKTRLINVAENILDTTHTAHVHGSLLRKESAQRSLIAKVEEGESFVQVTYPPEAAPSGLITWLIGSGEYEITDRFDAPGIAHIIYRIGGKTAFCAQFFLTPAEAGQTHILGRFGLPRDRVPAWLKFPLLKTYFRRIFAEDEIMLAGQQANLEDFGNQARILIPADPLRAGMERLLNGKAQPGHRQVRMRV